MNGRVILLASNDEVPLPPFSNRENIQRLQKCLRGKAKDSVHALLNQPDQLERINYEYFNILVEMIISLMKRCIKSIIFHPLEEATLPI